MGSTSRAPGAPLCYKLLRIVQQLHSSPPELRPVLLVDNSSLAAGPGARRGQGDRLHCQFESERVSHSVVSDAV